MNNEPSTESPTAAALRSVRLHLEHLAFGLHTSQLTGVNDGALSLRAAIARSASMEKLTEDERRAYHSLNQLADRLVGDSEEFRLECGKIVSAHENLLTLLDRAATKAEDLWKVTNDLEESVDRVKTLVAEYPGR